jgi:hypothetical protein
LGVASVDVNRWDLIVGRMVGIEINVQGVQISAEELSEIKLALVTYGRGVGEVFVSFYVASAVLHLYSERATEFGANRHLTLKG